MKMKKFCSKTICNNLTAIYIRAKCVKYKHLSLLCALTGFIVCIICCGCNNDKKPVSKNTISGKNILYSIKDSTGYTTYFYDLPRRILPISNGMTAVVIDLVDPERILAVSEDNLADGSIIKDKARKVKKHFAGWASTEMIIQLKPDLVLMPETSDITKVQTLRDLGIPVVITIAPRNMEQIQSRVLFTAKAVHAENKGIEVIAKMNAKLTAIKEMKQKIGNGKKTIIAFSSQGAYGRKGGLFDNLCSVAGVINGAAGIGLKKMDHLSQEQIIQINPDFFLLPKVNNDDSYAKEIVENPAYKGINAVKNKQYIILEEESYRYTVSQHAADVAYLIADAVYHPYLKKVALFDY